MSLCFSPSLNKTVRAARWAALVAAMLFLPGCGPGTGGTGNGENTAPLDYFGAAPANVCTTGPVSALACPPGGNTGAVGANEPPSASSGSDGVLFADVTGTNDVAVGITGNRVALTARCLDLHFEGDWGLAGGSDGRYFGRYRFGPDGQSVLASLTVQAAGSDNKSLSALLRDHEGRVVLGPLLLRRVLVPVSNPAACPG
jgi:hypothetical protein